MKPVPNLAKLKRLPKAKQKRLFDWLTGDTEKGVLPLSHKDAIARIKKNWKFAVAPGQLSEFYAWYPDSLELQEVTTFREEMQDFLRDNPDINLESDTITKLGQLLFEKRAIRNRDPQLFVKLRRLRQKDLDQAMDRDQFEVESIERFLKWYSMVKMRELADSDLPHSAKITAMRKVAFQDVDTLEKSGKLTLPPA